MTDKDTPAYIRDLREQRTAGIFSKDAHWIESEKGLDFLKKEIENNEHVQGLVKFAYNTNSGVESLHHTIENIEQTSHKEISQLQQDIKDLTRKQPTKNDNGIDIHLIQEQLNFLFDFGRDRAKVYGAYETMPSNQLLAISLTDTHIKANSPMGQHMVKSAVYQRARWNDPRYGNFAWTKEQAPKSPFLCLGLTHAQANLKNISRDYVYNREILRTILAQIKSNPDNAYLTKYNVLIASADQIKDYQAMKTAEDLLLGTDEYYNRMRQKFGAGATASQDEMFGARVRMPQERFNKIIAMKNITVESKTGQYMIETATQQIIDWNARGNMQWVDDFSHTQVYTALGLTPEQGKARNQSGYVYNHSILKKLARNRLFEIRPDQVRARKTADQIRDHKIVNWAFKCFGFVTKEQSDSARAKYEDDVSRNNINKDNAETYYNDPKEVTPTQPTKQNKKFALSDLFV